MIIIEFNNLKNLNTSLQVGDAVYARGTLTQVGANDPQAGSHNVQLSSYVPTGQNHFVGILRKIENLGNNQYELHVDDDPTKFPFSTSDPYEGDYYLPSFSDFIMFSKFEQGDSGVIGYYAKAKFINNSKEKAELFAVSSEVIINSN
jgi:hypothetical protein